MRGRAARRGSASRAGTLRDGRSGEPDAPGGARGARPRGAKGSTSAWGAPAPWEAPASGECAPAREKRCYFVCWLPGYGEAFIFSSLKYLPLCNLLGLQVGASRMKGHLDRSRSPVFMTCWGFDQIVLQPRLTMSGKRKGVWTGQNLERKFVTGLGRSRV